MMMSDYLAEFAADWQLLGKSPNTARLYCRRLADLVGDVDPSTVTLAAVKRWLADSPSPQTARMRGRAVRAFGIWAANNDGPSWTWSQQVPLAKPVMRPQATVTEQEYRAALAKCRKLRHRVVVELLWSTGMRVSEIARIQVSDIDFAGGFVVVPRTKNGRPRVAPLSESARRACRRLVGARETGPLHGMSDNGIRLLCYRLGCPSPHAWRRGWAVEALRRGVSEASVRAAAGWSSGTMVMTYVAACSESLAIAEFTRVRAS